MLKLYYVCMDYNTYCMVYKNYLSFKYTHNTLYTYHSERVKLNKLLTKILLDTFRHCDLSSYSFLRKINSQNLTKF